MQRIVGTISNRAAVVKRIYKTRRIELKRFYLPNYLYFVTSVIESRRKIFANNVNINVLLDSFCHYRKEQGFKIVAFCILPDHFHWLIIPAKRTDISQIMKSVRGFSARKINKESNQCGRLWQHQFLDHIIRKDEDYKQHIYYIHNNPVKHGLVEEAEDYPWSSYRNYYLDDDSLFRIDKLPL